jgi:hypothetical protein
VERETQAPSSRTAEVTSQAAIEDPEPSRIAAEPEPSIEGPVLARSDEVPNVVAEDMLVQEAVRTETAGRTVLDSIAAAPVTILASEAAEGRSAGFRPDSASAGVAALSALPSRTKPSESPMDVLFAVSPPRGESVDAAAMETASLAIPGLEVLSTEWEERVPGEKALLIRQLVAPGDTLELRYLGLLLGTDPDPEASRERTAAKEAGTSGRVYANVLAASLPPGWQQVVMERDRGLVVARGPFAEPHLKSLLKRIR